MIYVVYESITVDLLTTLILAVDEIYPQSSGREDADSGTDMCLAGRPHCLLLSLPILTQCEAIQQSSFSLPAIAVRTSVSLVVW